MLPQVMKRKLRIWDRKCFRKKAEKTVKRFLVVSIRCCLFLWFIILQCKYTFFFVWRGMSVFHLGCCFHVSQKTMFFLGYLMLFRFKKCLNKNQALFERPGRWYVPITVPAGWQPLTFHPLEVYACGSLGGDSFRKGVSFFSSCPSGGVMLPWNGRTQPSKVQPKNANVSERCRIKKNRLLRKLGGGPKGRGFS